MNYIQPVRENPASSPVQNTGKEDDRFSKTLDDIQSRTNNREDTKKTEPQRNHRRERSQEKSENTPEPSEKTDKSEEAEISDEQKAKDALEKEASAAAAESFLTNLDFLGTVNLSGTNGVLGEAANAASQGQSAANSAVALTDSKLNLQTALLKNAPTTEEITSAKQTADAIASNVKTQGEVQIKASEQVAAAAKDNALTQTQDMSSKAKETALANLQSIEGTDTTVVESQSSSDAKSGSSFSQGSASEQVIKMSIENAAGDKTSNAADFSVHLNKQASGLNNLPQAKEINKADVMSQINQQMDDLQQTGNSKVTIILKPENLGRIHLEIMNSHEGITAKLMTENQQVKELLDKNMEALKGQLSSQGVNVSNIKVETTNQTANNSMNFERDQFNQNTPNQSGQNQSSETDSTQRHSEEEGLDEFSQANNAETTQSERHIKHDGKVDYKV